jgi:dihydroxy-acid dehydratase
VHAKTLKDALDAVGHQAQPVDAVKTFYMAGPAGIPTQVAFSQSTRWPSLDTDRAEGCIRSYDHAFSQGRRPGRADRQHRAQRLRGQNRRRG